MLDVTINILTGFIIVGNLTTIFFSESPTSVQRSRRRLPVALVLLRLLPGRVGRLDLVAVRLPGKSLLRILPSPHAGAHEHHQQCDHSAFDALNQSGGLIFNYCTEKSFPNWSIKNRGAEMRPKLYIEIK